MESARTLLARIPSFFYHHHSYTSEATELQQTPKQGIFSRHGPRTVEVAAVQDKKAFLSSCAFQCTPFNYLCSPCLLLRGQKASSSRAANHMATGHHRKLSPPTHRRLQHSLELTLRHQVQQPHNDNDASHCGLVSCFFSVVHLLHTSMVVDAVAYAHLSYFRFWLFCIAVRVFHYFVNDVFSPCDSCGTLDSVNPANKRNISRCPIG